MTWQSLLKTLNNSSPKEQEQAIERCEQLVTLTLEHDRRVNLTAIRERDLFAVRHLEDTCRAAAVMLEGMGQAPTKLADIGSGGGVPGRVWAILWPQAGVHLIEAAGKKCDFLRATAAALELPNVTVHQGRAERIGHDPALREAFDCVTARAVAELPVLLELTAPLLAAGGWLAAIKSARIEAEWDRAAHAAQTLMGADLSRLSPLAYQRSDGCQCTVCLIKKRQKTPELYPRRDGVPLKRPLLK